VDVDAIPATANGEGAIEEDEREGQEDDKQ
jgi:hypothetical protein